MNENPLQQYFRRPGVYLRLPSGGKGYPEGAIEMPESGELPVYPMTAIDEITAKTPDALFNGTAVAELVKSCIPAIKDPWTINNLDLDSILIAIRSASGGNEMEIESTCPKCENRSVYGLNLTSVLATMKPADYGKELQVTDLLVKFKPLTYKQMNDTAMKQFEVQKLFTGIEAIPDDNERATKSQEALKLVTELTMQVLAQTIEYIKTPDVLVDNSMFIYDFLKNCDKNIYIAIRDYNAKLKQTTELQPLDVRCLNCSNEYKQPFTLNASDFFG
jgi:hypothetical protein